MGKCSHVMMPRLLICVVMALVGIGCRAEARQRGVDRTIVVRDETQAEPQGGYDSGEREPERIEVVVAGPRGATGTSPLTSLIGKSCRVQFRRDALGLAATAPVPPTGQGPGGRAVSIEGTVRSVAAGWLVLERGRTIVWVAQSTILLIEVFDAPATLPSVE